MNKLRILFTTLTVLFPLVSYAQKTITASGEYVYNAPTNITLDQAEVTALERAKNQIIADHFGTVVGVSNTSLVKNAAGESDVTFLSIGETEVMGEWLETKGEPEFQISYEKGFQVIKVKVTGVIREITASRTQFEAKVLRNGTDDRFESDKFSDNDYFFISFATPENGYLAIYLFDGNTVSRLLPLMNSQKGSFEVKGGEKYVLFEQPVSNYSAKGDGVGRYAKSIYQLTCSQENELNRIYIVFSPNKFTRAIDSISEDNLPASLTFEDFQHWLSRTRKHDIEMGVMLKDILISK